MSLFESEKYCMKIGMMYNDLEKNVLPKLMMNIVKMFVKMIVNVIITFL